MNNPHSKGPAVPPTKGAAPQATAKVEKSRMTLENFPTDIVEGKDFDLHPDLTQPEFDEILELLSARYAEAEKILFKAFVSLEGKHKSFPDTFNSSDDHEKFLIQCSQYKHASITLSQMLLSSSGQLEIDYGYFEGNLQLYFAKKFLQELGFDNPTESNRKSFVNSNGGLRKLNKTLEKLKSVRQSSDRLIKAFESDEFNFRTFLGMKNKLKGL